MLHDLLSNTALLGVLLGAVTPLAVAVVQQPGWSKRTRTAVAVVCSAVIGLLTVAATGGLGDGSLTATTVVAVVAAAKVAYHKLWRKASKVIEAATTLPAGRVN